MAPTGRAQQRSSAPEIATYCEDKGEDNPEVHTSNKPGSVSPRAARCSLIRYWRLSAAMPSHGHRLGRQGQGFILIRKIVETRLPELTVFRVALG